MNPIKELIEIYELKQNSKFVFAKKGKRVLNISNYRFGILKRDCKDIKVKEIILISELFNISSQELFFKIYNQTKQRETC